MCSNVLAILVYTLTQYVMYRMFHQLLLPPPVQVTLPQEVGPRYEHTATVFGSGSNFRMVVMFGGKREWGGNRIAETTLLHLGECAVIRQGHIQIWKHD